MTTANACVQATPCTWAQLLAAFPNLGVHSTYGAVILKAGSGWATFRGNVDSLAIAVDSVATTFDFEHSGAQPVRLKVDVHPSVLGSWPADSTYAPGTTLSYAVQGAPGRATPIVVLDDTLAGASGSIVMDGPHVLQVVSDTVYSYATLSPLEKSLADLTTELLTAGDKPAAFQAIIDFALAAQRSGTSAAELERASALAQYVTIDPIRDSTALRVTDEALAGWDFYVEYGEDQEYSTFHVKEATGATAVAAPGANPTLRSQNRRAAARPARTGSSARTGPSARINNTAYVGDPEDPREGTLVLYTNGVWTEPVAAGVTTALLASAVYAQPRFGNYYTNVYVHYNPTYKVQMAEYDRTHPCVVGAIRDLSFMDRIAAAVKYAGCKTTRFVKSVTSNDIVESATARFQMLFGLQPTNDTVLELVDRITAGRQFNNHLLLVGHSEGTILQAQAVSEYVRRFPRPIQVANRCVAAVALAPATTHGSYGLDDHHLKGIIARNDIVDMLLPGGGWQSIDTPLSQTARDSIFFSDEPALTAIQFGVQIHSVNDTYLGEGMGTVMGQLGDLHRECMPGKATLGLSTRVAPVGSTFTIGLDIWNQNNRPLIGRQIQRGNMEWGFERLDSLTFRAMVPSETDVTISAFITAGLEVSEPLTIPILDIPFSIVEARSSHWSVWAGSNGPNGSWNPGPMPTDVWDGSPSSCPRFVTVAGSSGDLQTWVMQCSRTYTPVWTAPDTLASGRRINRAAVHYTYASGETDLGPTTYYFCDGSAPCILSGT